MDADAAVRAWYAARFGVTDLGYKCFDWRLLGHAPVQGQRVLNCGCGYPLDEVAWAPLAASWSAVDFTPEVIEQCVAMLPTLRDAMGGLVVWRVADMRDLCCFPDQVFTRILDFSSSDHIADGRERWWREAHRVLAPGGRAVITYANRAFFQDGRRDAYGDFGYECRLLPEELIAEVCAVGFTPVYDEHASARSGLVVERPR